MTEPDESNASLRDPRLSRLYQAAGEQVPPAALDAAILSAARAAVATRAAPALPWWKRLTVPAAVAATTLLAVMLSLTMERNAPEVAEVAPPRPMPAAPAAATAQIPVPIPSMAKDAAPSAFKGSTDRGTLAREVAQTPAPVAAPATAVESKAKVAAPPPAMRDMAAPQSPAMMEGRQGAPAAKAESMNAADSAAPERARSTLAAPAPAPAMAPAGAAAPMLESAAKRAAPRPEIVWLEEIRELRRQGRHEDAARRLAAFRAAYPDYPLPDDMK